MNAMTIDSKVLSVVATMFTLTGCATTPAPRDPMGLASLTQTGDVDERFQSYNVEMVEVTGGRFWAPYGGPASEVYRMRPPADLSNAKLRGLAANLGPAYMRVSGTWANSTYIPAEGETVSTPPPGYQQVLTRAQWRGLVDFARASNSAIVTSFAVSPGTRGSDGVWRTEQAQRLLDLTREFGGTIAAAEFYNEPNASMVGGLPRGYSPTDYARDFRIFHQWARAAAPEMKLVGPSSVGEGAVNGVIPVNARNSGAMLSTDLLQNIPGTLDVFSYHFYGNVSQRCAAARPTTANKAEALSPAWLDLTLRDLHFYSGVRDRFEPGDPLWITETAQAACGGSPWASTFLDSFRYVNQLGLLAQNGVKVVMHNTLAASDYSLIDEESLTPRPNYWAAVLWKRTMGTRVLAAPTSPSADLRLYAHCLAGSRGGVALVAINLGSASQSLNVGQAARQWNLTAQPLDSGQVLVNGLAPTADAQGRLQGLNGARVSGPATIAPQSISYLALPNVGNAACR